MDSKKQVTKNPHLLFWGRALVEAKILSAIIVLFYIHRGLELDEIFYLSIVWSITSLVTEVPTGYLADLIGRKKTILLGVLLLLTSQVISFFAYGFWPFVLTFIFMSASFSFFSGTEEAMLFESLTQAGNGHEINARQGKQFAARALPDIFLPALGAFIARDLVESQFQLLIAINMVIAIAALFVLGRLVEPERTKSVAQLERGIFTQSLQTIRREPWLLKAALNKLLVFIAVFITWRTSQPLLAEHGFGAETLGVFYIVFQGIEFVGGWFAGSIERKLGTTTIIFLSPVIMVVLLILAITTSQPWLIFVSLALTLSMNSLRDAMFASAINNRIHSHSRATTLSNLNVLKGFLDIPVLFLAGWLSGVSLSYPILLAIGLCLIVLVVLPIRKRELTAPVTQSTATLS